jgi:ribosomal protein S18 acetylase RimI-like enzyme
MHRGKLFRTQQDHPPGNPKLQLRFLPAKPLMVAHPIAAALFIKTAQTDDRCGDEEEVSKAGGERCSLCAWFRLAFERRLPIKCTDFGTGDGELDSRHPKSLQELSMGDKDLEIRTMNMEEIHVAIEWAAKEGWNPGVHDADCFYSADPSGFLMGFLGEEPISSISVVKYGDSFGFLGLYIVRPEYRGRGFGIRIWNAGLKYLEGRVVGLDGVIAQQDNYRKSGFKLAYRNIRYEGQGGGKFPVNFKIVKLASLPFDIVQSYDRPFFPAERSRFLKCWIEQPDSNALGIVEGGKLAGYGIIRKCGSGHKMGPLFADRPELAEALFLALRSAIDPSEPFYLDIPEVSPAAAALVNRHNMNMVFETARMYLGETPDLPLDRIFGVTSFELG